MKNVRTCIFKKSQHISPQFDQLPFSVQVSSLFVEHFFSVGSFSEGKDLCDRDS